MNKKDKYLDNNTEEELSAIKNKTSEEKSQDKIKGFSQTNKKNTTNTKISPAKSEKNGEENHNSKLKNEVSNLREEKLRVLAEMENLRKRFERDKIDSIKYGSINIARDMLSPSDNLSRALEAIPVEKNMTNSISNLIQGLKMVQKEFMTILEKHGVKKIDSINNKFDHNLHQAMLEIETDEYDEGVVVKEIQSGFTMHDRLLRPSMVGVSKKPKNKKKNPKKD